MHAKKMYVGSLFLLMSKCMAGPSPFSKITISSKKMDCSVLSGKKGTIFDYQGDVVMTFADDTTINADNLIVTLNFQKTEAKRALIPAIVASIKMLGNIVVKSQENTVSAQKAEVFPENNTCMVSGKVKVRHTKKKPSDIGVDLESPQATINLATKEITFLGEIESPVSTVLTMDNYSFGKKTANRQGISHGKNKNSTRT